MSGPRAYQKAHSQLVKADEAAQATLKEAKKGQLLHDAINAAVLGYVNWPALSDNGLGITAELRRAVINTRPQKYTDLKGLWESTNFGRDLQNHDLVNAILILISPKILNTQCLTFDTSAIRTIEFLPEWRGKAFVDATAAEKELFPVLGNGGHRLELLRTFVYQDKLKAYYDLSQKINNWDEKGKNARSREPLIKELEALEKELQQVTWVAKILDLDKINAHPNAIHIKTELASNKLIFQVEETVQNTLTMFFDALNGQHGVNSGNITKILNSLVEQNDSKGQRIRKALSSTHLTYAYSRLCLNSYFHRDMPFTITALNRWRRGSSAYAITYMHWMALTFEILFSDHSMTVFPDTGEDAMAYFANPISHSAHNEVRKKLWAFNQLAFNSKQTRFDIFDDAFYTALKTADTAWQNVGLNLFGFKSDQMDDNMRAKYAETYTLYTDILFEEVTKWIQDAQLQFANDSSAKNIIAQIPGKLKFLVTMNL
ncbi:hypothetical protein C0989_001869 [Termitomyces sp. Mn162]|nr:hypothetical protein C0989_001869 [Termitomyces sp. Mn162]